MCAGIDAVVEPQTTASSARSRPGKLTRFPGLFLFQAAMRSTPSIFSLLVRRRRRGRADARLAVRQRARPDCGAQSGLRAVQRRADQLPRRGQRSGGAAAAPARSRRDDARVGAAQRLPASRCSTSCRIPVSSQTLVFSKTSFQYKKISPQTPRALYFNDDVYVGKVHDGKAIEIISFDARQGAIFYLLDEQQVERPTVPACRARLHRVPRRGRHAQRSRRAGPLDLPDADRHAGRADAVVLHRQPEPAVGAVRRLVRHRHAAARQTHMGNVRVAATASIPRCSIAPPAPTSPISRAGFDTSPLPDVRTATSSRSWCRRIRRRCTT